MTLNIFTSKAQFPNSTDSTLVKKFIAKGFKKQFSIILVPIYLSLQNLFVFQCLASNPSQGLPESGEENNRIFICSKAFKPVSKEDWRYVFQLMFAGRSATPLEKLARTGVVADAGSIFPDSETTRQRFYRDADDYKKRVLSRLNADYSKAAAQPDIINQILLRLSDVLSNLGRIDLSGGFRRSNFMSVSRVAELEFLLHWLEEVIDNQATLYSNSFFSHLQFGSVDLTGAFYTTAEMIFSLRELAFLTDGFEPDNFGGAYLGFDALSIETLTANSSLFSFARPLTRDTQFPTMRPTMRKLTNALKTLHGLKLRSTNEIDRTQLAQLATVLLEKEDVSNGLLKLLIGLPERLYGITRAFTRYTAQNQIAKSYVTQIILDKNGYDHPETHFAFSPQFMLHSSDRQEWLEFEDHRSFLGLYDFILSLKAIEGGKKTETAFWHVMKRMLIYLHSLKLKAISLQFKQNDLQKFEIQQALGEWIRRLHPILSQYRKCGLNEKAWYHPGSTSSLLGRKSVSELNDEIDILTLSELGKELHLVTWFLMRHSTSPLVP